MKEKIYKKDDKIIIEIPFYSKRFNPYIPDLDIGEYPTLTAIIGYDEDGNDELGFARTIDMNYKGKDDQWTEIQYHYWDNRDDFIKLCENLGIKIIQN